MAPIEWHRGLADSRAGRTFAYVFVGSATGLLGLFGLLALLVLPAVVVALWANPAMAALVALFALVGGPLSLVYLWPLLTDRAQRQPLVSSSGLGDLPRSGIVIATVGGALAHLLAVWLYPAGPFVVFLGGVLLGSLGLHLWLTEGRVDPAALTLRLRSALANRESRGPTVDLTTWTDVATYDLGSIVVLRPTYARGVRGPNPRLVPLPADVAEDVLPVVERALETSAPEPDRPPNPAVAATLAMFGLSILAFGVAVVALGIGATSFRAYAVALSGLLAAVFLVAAWREY